MSQSYKQMLKALGDRVNQLRVDSNMTQLELAHRADVSVSFLGGVEIAQVDGFGEPVKVPSLKTLHRLAEALGCEVSDFFRDGG